MECRSAIENSTMAKKTRGRPVPQSADEVILDVLIWFDDDHKDTEQRIKRRLRYHNLGPYQQERLELLRRLNDETCSEIKRYDNSRYFSARHGNHSDPKDFDIDRWIADLSASYPEVPRAALERFIPWAVYWHYLR